MNHGQTQTHKAHHSLELREATTFPLIVYFVPDYGTSTQMSFCPETPKWESRNSHNYNSRDFGAHNFVCRPQLKWSLKQGCSPHWKLSNGMRTSPARKEIRVIPDF